MIGYICKYTPIEIFESMGLEMKRIEPEVASFNQADTLMHPNIWQLCQRRAGGRACQPL